MNHPSTSQPSWFDGRRLTAAAHHEGFSLARLTFERAPHGEQGAQRPSVEPRGAAGAGLTPDQIAADLAEMSAKFTETGGDVYVSPTGEKRGD